MESHDSMGRGRVKRERGCDDAAASHANLRHAAQASAAMTPARERDPVVPGASEGAHPGLRWWPFVILAGAGAVAFLGSARRGPVTGPPPIVWALVLTTGFAVALLLEAAARACVNRQRLAPGFDASPEASRVVLDATAGLTRVLSLAISLFMSLVVVPQALSPGTGTGRTLGFGTAILLGAIAWAVRSLKSVHRRLERAGQLGGLEGWNGITYSNAKDPRLWVPKLSGFGATLNFAHIRSWLILGAILVLPLLAAGVALLSVFSR